jgi:hypothetical protein
MDPMALYDTLQCVTLALITAEGGKHAKAEEALLEAAIPAPDAFPPGPLADALFLILGAVGDFVNGVPA